MTPYWYRNRTDAAHNLSFGVAFVVFCIFLLVLLSNWTHRSIVWVLAHNGFTIEWSWWGSFALSLVLNIFWLPINFIVECVRLIVGG